MEWKIAVPIVAVAFSALVSSPQAGPPPTVTFLVKPEQQAAAMSLWTRARIADAPAIEMPVDTGVGGVDVDALDEADVTGLERMKAPGMAAPNADQIARAAFPEDWKALGEEVVPEAPADIPTGTPGTYTYYDVNTNSALWQIYPHLWDGKFTFMTPGGPSSCSATALRGNNIVTAAHCVYDTTTNSPYSNFALTPAYRNGSTPYGTFPVTACTILTAYVNLSGAFSINTWTRYDVAVCTLGNNAAGQTLNGAVGYAGLLWDASYNQLNFNSGYPQRTYTLALITNGPTQYLRACTNESFQQTTDTLGGGCFWGPGISGGSWLVNYKPFVVSGLVNSVNSGLFTNQQNIYGARFTSNNIAPLCSARGC